MRSPGVTKMFPLASANGLFGDGSHRSLERRIDESVVRVDVPRICLQRDAGFNPLAQGLGGIDEEALAKHGGARHVDDVVGVFSAKGVGIPGQLAVGSAQPKVAERGDNRRLIIALGFLTRHPILLMDEPFDGVDVRHALSTHCQSPSPERSACGQRQTATCISTLSPWRRLNEGWMRGCPRVCVRRQAEADASVSRDAKGADRNPGPRMTAAPGTGAHALVQVVARNPERPTGQ